MAVAGAEMRLSVPQTDAHEMSGGADDASTLALLPKHTKVRVSGNSRTKCSLINLEGVVKKAVGLGGWHWLVLSSGEEVKLQRNALQVLELPTGNEPDFTDDDEETTTRQPTTPEVLPAEELPRIRARRPGRAYGGTAVRSPGGLAVAEPTPTLGAIIGKDGRPSMKVNFLKLDCGALRRYHKHFNLTHVPEDCPKQELAQAVGEHFNKTSVDEAQVIDMFFRAAKRVRA
ncbi:unnamed protein product [Pedinophyceae sp. YPF-701]|nr:unnamed protein product [Pedinophyceae sp. YPF-701]